MQRRTLLKAFALSASVVAMGMSFGVQAPIPSKWGSCILFPAPWPSPKRR